MNSELELRQRLLDFQAGDDTYELEDWLLDVSSEHLPDPEGALTASALRLIVESQNGDWTAAELGDMLATLARTYTFDETRLVNFAELEASVIEVQANLAASAETRRVMASV